MTLTELKTALATTGYPVAYMAFPETVVPDMPFICYMATNTDNFAADGIVYEKVQKAEIQLFTSKKDTVAEGQVETALSSMFWNKEEEYEEDEICYRVIYSVTL